MTIQKTKKIFKAVAEALEMEEQDVIDKFNEKDTAIVKWVTLAQKMEECK